LKISKTSLIFLAVGVIAILAFCIGTTRAKQVSERQTLETKLTQAQQKLTSLQYDDLKDKKTQLTVQIERYNTQAESTQSKLSSNQTSITATDLIIETARYYDVDITAVSSGGESTGALSGTRCATLPVVINVQGKINNIANFVYSLSQKFPTSTVSNVKISQDSTQDTEASSSESSGADSDLIASAAINLIIYDYKGE